MDHEALEKRKKTIYSLLCDDFYVPMKAKEMAMLLQIPKSQRAELQEVLDALVADGKADVSKKGKYSKAKHHFVTGVFESHPKGFGFLRMEEGEDIYIPESEVHGAVDRRKEERGFNRKNLRTRCHKSSRLLRTE